MKTVLSVQSAVTFGAVGNTMASAVMSALGHHIARIDTVQLIAHPGHGLWAGGAPDHNNFTYMIASLLQPSFAHNVNAVITGYMGNAPQVELMADTIAKLAEMKADLPVMVDPAIGDHGRLYVKDDVATAIETVLIPQAHIITPNAYEFRRLTGLEDTADVTMDAVFDAGKALMAKHPKMVGIAITGWAHEDMISDFWIDHKGMISHDAPRQRQNAKGMAGGGDLFAATMMGQYCSSNDWRDAFQKAAESSRRIINGADKEGAIDIDLAIVKNVLEAGN